MTHLQKILAVALAEMRSSRRLIRYWIFTVLSVGLSVVIFLYYSAIHGFASRLSATIGSTGPRFLIQAMGIYLMAIFLIGIIFLAFDVRARDQRERMDEVLDSRPISNLELLAGRMIGLVIMAWVPFLAVAVLFQSIGAIANLFDWWMGQMVEPYSLLAFVFIDGLTALVVWCAVVIFLAMTLRNRLLVTVAAFVLLALQVWILFKTPLYLLPAISALSSFGNLASDVLPSAINTPTLIQRVALWVFSIGLLIISAAFHPRPDSGSRPRQLMVGGGLLALSLITIGVLATRSIGEIETRESWAAAHKEQQEAPRPDIESVTGVVRIEPGKRLGLEIEMAVGTSGTNTLDDLVFSFNPGMRVESVKVGGSDAQFEHELGLLSIELPQPLRPGSNVSVALEAAGVPDPTFAYLDSVKDILTGTSWEAQLALLGTENAIFHRSYVALMPGISWLPRPGSNLPNADPTNRPNDFFEVDLEVEVPSGWLVAGPGKREEVPGGTGDRFRFHPSAPVPQIGLLASRFERYATEAAGIELELLIHRKHLHNVEYFKDSSEALTTRLEELFGDAKKLGLEYPYGSLTLVEAPASLRSYGGGWRMDSVLSMPAVMLLREHGFPTSRFEFGFRNVESFEDREGGIESAKVEALETFFENDFSGGNPFFGVSRNFLQFQTSASGDGALALDFLCDELVNQLLTRKGGYFSAYIFDQTSGAVIGETITEMVAGNSDSVAAALLKAAADKPSVWDRALGTSLANLDTSEDPQQALNVLALKGRALALSILDGLGREQTGALLTELRRRHTGSNFTAEDLKTVATDLGIDLEPLIGDWLNDASLPGFMSSKVSVVRLRDDDQGRPRYQTRLHIRNDEPTPGILRMRYGVGELSEDSDWQESDPIRVGSNESLEIGLLSSEPPKQLWLEPYLSLNRQNLRLDLPEIDEQAEVGDEPFLGTRPSEWLPMAEDEGAIVVDDLDPGFSVLSDKEDDGVRLSGGISELFAPAADLDQGLPEHQPFGPPARSWSRQEIPGSWGKYRHTIAMARKGKGDHKAVFAAELPTTGRWRLEYHIPVLTSVSRTTQERGVRINAQVGLGGTEGSYDMTLEVGEGGSVGETIEFDGKVAESGWNQLGEFDLTDKNVRLVVSNDTDGRAVVADAIRWTPLGAR